MRKVVDQVENAQTAFLLLGQGISTKNCRQHWVCWAKCHTRIMLLLSRRTMMQGPYRNLLCRGFWPVVLSMLLLTASPIHGRQPTVSELESLSLIVAVAVGFPYWFWFFPCVQCWKITTNSATTQEEIMASRQSRKKRLQGVLDNILKKLEAHHHPPSGGATPSTTILSEQQLAHLQQRSQVYRHQIEELDRELDEEVV